MMEFFFLGAYLAVVFFIFYLNFTVYSIILLLFLYLLVFSLLLLIGLELIGLFLIIIYVGGVLTLFLFLMFLVGYNNNNSDEEDEFSCLPPEKEKKFYYFIFLLLFIFYAFIFLFFLEHFDTSGDFLKKCSEINNYSLIFKYLILKGKVRGFDSNYPFFFGVRLYSYYFLPLLLTFLIFFLSLICVVSVSWSFSSYNSSPNILVFNKNVRLDRFKNFVPFAYFKGWDEGFIYLSDIDITGELPSVTLLFYLSTLSVILLMSCLPLILSNFNFIKFLVWVEIFVLSICGWMVYFSYWYSDVDGLIFTVLLFGIYAAETVIGLALFSFYKLNSDDLSNKSD